MPKQGAMVLQPYYGSSRSNKQLRMMFDCPTCFLTCTRSLGRARSPKSYCSLACPSHGPTPTLPIQRLAPCPTLYFA
jgi:hypothetical protein